MLKLVQVVLVVVATGIAPFPAYTSEVQKVCAKYLGTGKSYVVDANIISGTELNQNTQSLDYNSFATYAVIFWSNEQASVIEMDGIFCPSIVGCEGKDQRGLLWEVTHTPSGYCF